MRYCFAGAAFAFGLAGAAFAACLAGAAFAACFAGAALAGAALAACCFAGTCFTATAAFWAGCCLATGAAVLPPVAAERMVSSWPPAAGLPEAAPVIVL